MSYVVAYGALPRYSDEENDFDASESELHQMRPAELDLNPNSGHYRSLVYKTPPISVVEDAQELVFDTRNIS